MNKTTIKKQLAIGEKVLDNMPLEQLQRIPYAFYLKSYIDVGYVQGLKNNENNSILTDKFLVGGGLGIDAVTFYDLVVRMEYSVTIEKFNKKNLFMDPDYMIRFAGFFLHVRKEF